MDEIELRMFCISHASALDNDTPNDLISSAEVVYMWLTGTVPATNIASINKDGDIVINPNDN